MMSKTILLELEFEQESDKPPIKMGDYIQVPIANSDKTVRAKIVGCDWQSSNRKTRPIESKNDGD